MTLRAGAFLVTALWIAAPAGLLASTPAAGRQTAFAVSGAACHLGKVEGDGLRVTYWELFRLTEVCTPAETDRTPALSLSLVLVYEGRPPAGSLYPVAKGTPVQVLARVESNAAYVATSPRFTMAMGGRRVDLTAPGRQHQLLYPCDLSMTRCAWNGVVSRIEMEELGQLAQASAVWGHALGVDFTLTPAGLASLLRIAARAGAR